MTKFVGIIQICGFYCQTNTNEVNVVRKLTFANDCSALTYHYSTGDTAQ